MLIQQRRVLLSLKGLINILLDVIEWARPPSGTQEFPRYLSKIYCSNQNILVYGEGGRSVDKVAGKWFFRTVCLSPTHYYYFFISIFYSPVPPWRNFSGDGSKKRVWFYKRTTKTRSETRRNDFVRDHNYPERKTDPKWERVRDREREAVRSEEE